MFVCVSEAAIVLFLKLVFRAAGRWTAALPEHLDEVVAARARGKSNEGRAFFWRDDPADFMIQLSLVLNRQINWRLASSRRILVSQWLRLHRYAHARCHCDEEKVRSRFEYGSSRHQSLRDTAVVPN